MATIPEENSGRTVDSRTWRLVLTRDAWEVAMRGLLMNRDAWAVGPLAWGTSTDAHEVLAESLAVSISRPSGRSRPPLSDWLVIRIVDAMSITTAEIRDRIATELNPLLGQLLLVLLLDSGNRHRWEGTVYRHDMRESLDEVRVIGPGMLRISRLRDQPRQIEEHLATRASRTSGALGADAHRRIQDSTVTLIGAGRVATLLAFQFAGLGVARLRIVDHDIVGWENLDAMQGLTVQDVGKNKALALAQRLLEFRPELSVTVLERSAIDATAIRFMRQRTDLMVTAVDNDTPRLAASIIASQTLTVHMDVGTSIQRESDQPVISADIRLMLPRAGCVVCVGGVANLDATLYDLNAPPGSLRRLMQPRWNQERAGSLAPVNSIATGAAVLMWIDLVSGRQRSSFWQRLAWDANEGIIADAAPVGPADDCPYCHDRGS